MFKKGDTVVIELNHGETKTGIVEEINLNETPGFESQWLLVDGEWYGDLDCQKATDPSDFLKESEPFDFEFCSELIYDSDGSHPASVKRDRNGHIIIVRYAGYDSEGGALPQIEVVEWFEDEADWRETYS